MKEVDFLTNTVGNYGFRPIIISALRFFLRNPYETLIIVDRNGRIEFLDRGSEKLFGLNQGEAKGIEIKNLFPQTSLPLTLETGLPVIGRIFEVRDKKGIGSCYPIIKDGRIIGALGKLTFYSLEEVNRLNNELDSLRSKIRYFKEKEHSEYRATYGFDDILGVSPLIRNSVEIAKKIALINMDVLILGESGTGKELFAHSIHNFNNADRKFVKVNCPAIPFELAESELFGYEKGAFSGAVSTGKPGKFEMANSGTIFLDEISSLPLSIQAKLLRVLQEREIERLGSTKTKKITFKFIATTNVDLKKLVEQKKFREDLYYRIAKTLIYLPPLRERMEDIPVYLNHFLQKINLSFKTDIKVIADDAMDVFLAYNWAGNIRELINVLEQCVLNAWHRGNKEINQEHLPKELILWKITANKNSVDNMRGISQEIKEKETELITSALRDANGNKRKAAMSLNMPRSTLYEKIKRYRIGYQR